MLKKSIVAAAASLAFALAAGVGTAQAHDKGGEKHMEKHDFDRHPHIQLFIGGGGCGYYYERWEKTGSLFWKRKYFICKGWW